MQTKDIEVAQKLRERMETIPVFQRMVVFGSRTRGDANPESDLDVFIEVSDLNAEIRRQIQVAAWEISLENGVMISTFVASAYSLTHGLLAANPLLKSIILDGVVV